MLHFFALSENKAGTHLRYFPHIKALINSALKNTRVSSVFIYDGEENEITEWLRSKRVIIVKHRSSIADFLIKNNGKYPNFNSDVALGTFLRLEIPLVMEKECMNDDIVLYTDCDVIFNKDIPTPQMSCPVGFAPEFNFSPQNLYYNSGVMLIDVKKFAKERTALIDFIINEVNQHKFQDYDQMAINMFFHKRHDILHGMWNWRSYHGINERAFIIHFHALKIEDMESLINFGYHKNELFTAMYKSNPDSVKYYYDKFKEYSE